MHKNNHGWEENNIGSGLRRFSHRDGVGEVFQTTCHMVSQADALTFVKIIGSQFMIRFVSLKHVIGITSIAGATANKARCRPRRGASAKMVVFSKKGDGHGLD
jgi:hypothetical protein